MVQARSHARDSAAARPADGLPSRLSPACCQCVVLGTGSDVPPPASWPAARRTRSPPPASGGAPKEAAGDSHPRGSSGPVRGRGKGQGEISQWGCGIRDLAALAVRPAGGMQRRVFVTPMHLPGNKPGARSPAVDSSFSGASVHRSRARRLYAMTRRNCDTKPPRTCLARNSSRLMALPEDPEGIYELMLELYTDGSAYNGTLSQRAHAEQAAAQVCPLLQCRSLSSPSPSPRVAGWAIPFLCLSFALSHGSKPCPAPAPAGGTPGTAGRGCGGCPAPRCWLEDRKPAAGPCGRDAIRRRLPRHGARRRVSGPRAGHPLLLRHRRRRLGRGCDLPARCGRRHAAAHAGLH